MAEGEIDNLTMEQYLALTRGKLAPGVVKPKIGGTVNFERKSQFMRELRDATFLGNKNDDAYEHVERVLGIVSLFNILGVSHDVVMMRVFLITLIGVARRWVDRLPPETVDSWDLLKRHLSKGPIPGMTHAQALTTIQTMADHSQKLRWVIQQKYRGYDERSPIRIVKNVLVKINRFLFPLDFVVMDMLNTRNETTILERPFLATIHAEIVVFNKEISLGIGGDRITFNMNKKIHNFTTPIGEIYMINSTSNSEYTFHTLSYASSRIEKTNDFHNEKNYGNKEQGRSCKKLRKLKLDINLPNTHFCKPVIQILKGELKFWLTCDPSIRECNGGPEIYGMDEEEVIRKWYCYHDDDRKRINQGGLSFHEFILVKNRETQEKELIWDDRFEEWCNNNPNTPTLRFTTVQENLNPRPNDYPFKDWLLTKENCKKVQGDNTYWWHDQKSKEEERRELGINIEEIQGYDLKGSRQWKEDPQKDVERLESNLKTR
nr:hypothetical protein [Tanacetum cinerariifolium]